MINCLLEDVLSCLVRVHIDADTWTLVINVDYELSPHLRLQLKQETCPSKYFFFYLYLAKNFFVVSFAELKFCKSFKCEWSPHPAGRKYAHRQI